MTFLLLLSGGVLVIFVSYIYTIFGKKLLSFLKISVYENPLGLCSFGLGLVFFSFYISVFVCLFYLSFSSIFSDLGIKYSFSGLVLSLFCGVYAIFFIVMPFYKVIGHVFKTFLSVRNYFVIVDNFWMSIYVGISNFLSFPENVFYRFYPAVFYRWNNFSASCLVLLIKFFSGLRDYLLKFGFLVFILNIFRSIFNFLVSFYFILSSVYLELSIYKDNWVFALSQKKYWLKRYLYFIICLFLFSWILLSFFISYIENGVTFWHTDGKNMTDEDYSFDLTCLGFSKHGAFMDGWRAMRNLTSFRLTEGEFSVLAFVVMFAHSFYVSCFYAALYYKSEAAIINDTDDRFLPYLFLNRPGALYHRGYLPKDPWWARGLNYKPRIVLKSLKEIPIASFYDEYYNDKLHRDFISLSDWKCFTEAWMATLFSKLILNCDSRLFGHLVPYVTKREKIFHQYCTPDMQHKVSYPDRTGRFTDYSAFSKDIGSPSHRKDPVRKFWEFKTKNVYAMKKLIGFHYGYNLSYTLGGSKFKSNAELMQRPNRSYKKE